jgi:hypothetical protein
MNLTPHHAKYFVYELTMRGSFQSAGQLTRAVASAQANRAGMTLRPITFREAVTEGTQMAPAAERPFAPNH